MNNSLKKMIAPIVVAVLLFACAEEEILQTDVSLDAESAAFTVTDSTILTCLIDSVSQDGMDDVSMYTTETRAYAFISTGHQLVPVIETLIFYKDLLVVGSTSIDSTTVDHPVKGIFREPVNASSGTSFSFNNHSLSNGTITMDSLVGDSLFYGNIDFQVHTDSSNYDLDIIINGLPLE